MLPKNGGQTNQDWTGKFVTIYDLWWASICGSGAGGCGRGSEKATPDVAFYFRKDVLAAISGGWELHFTQSVHVSLQFYIIYMIKCTNVTFCFVVSKISKLILKNTTFCVLFKGPAFMLQPIILNRCVEFKARHNSGV